MRLLNFEEDNENQNHWDYLAANDDVIAAAPVLPVFMASAAFSVSLPDPDYVLPGFQIGNVGIMSAAGGTGKSFWMLQAAFQIAACGYCDYALSGTQVEHAAHTVGSVLYVSLEDPRIEIMRRLQSIRNNWKQHDDELELNSWMDDLGDEFFHVLPLVGAGATLINQNGDSTEWLEAITNYAITMPSCRLIVIDTLRRAHDMDENDNGAMSIVLRHFEVLAEKTGAAVLLIHHEGKAAATNAQAGSNSPRGASAIVSNARWHMRLQRMTEADAQARGIVDDDIRKKWIRVTNEKVNYGEEAGEKWLLRGKMGVLFSEQPPVKVENNNVRKAMAGGRRYE